MSLTVLLLASLLGAPTPPACVQELIKAEVRAPAALHPAPTLSPARGPSGTLVTISSEGFSPGEVVTFAAVRATPDCTRAESFLGQAPVDRDGVARLEVAWPEVSHPLYAGVPASAEPGRYWVVAMACAARGACSLANGSAPGGPFVLVDRDGSRPVLPAALALVAVAAALWVRRRRARASGSR